MKRICAVIVTYNPDIKLLLKNISSIRNQVNKIYIIDNCSDNIEEIKIRTCDINNIDIFYNKKNCGIAKALNIGFKLAKKNDYEWVLTLDQDSVCSDDLVEKFLPFMNMKLVGIVCPLVEYKNYYRSKDHTGNEFDYVKACMTSGSMTSIYAWEKVGGFDSWLFIDCVDNDFCLKLEQMDLKVIRVNDVIMNHELGNTTKISFGCLTLTLFNYNSFRNYYIVRNTLYLNYKHRDKLFVTRNLLILIYNELVKIIFEKNKMGTVISLVRGVRDGLKKIVSFDVKRFK